jgi:glycosyltransferase involved in cell wall biosynthesis
MKIVFLQDDFPPHSMGGAGFSTYELALGMSRLGQDISVITTCRKEENVGESMYDGLKVYSIKSDYPERWRAYRSLMNISVTRKVEKILKELKPDVVHINNVHYHLSYHCFKIAQKYGKAVVFTGRDVMSFHYGKLSNRQYFENNDMHVSWREQLKIAGKRWNPLRNFVVRYYFTYADKLFAVSSTLRDAFTANGIQGVETLHTGTDVALWGAKEEEVSAFREKYGLEGKKVILFSGRLSEGKGGDKAIDMLRLVAPHVPEVVLFVAGSEDLYSEKMKNLVKQLGIEKNFIISGWLDRDKMRVGNAIADIVIVPSVCFDSLPRAIIEAMASGKPVIGTCFGGAPEIIVDGVTGYVVNPLYPEQIAEKVIELLQDTQKAEGFGRAGKQRIEKEFNLDDKVRQYIVEYEKIIERKELKRS